MKLSEGRTECGARTEGVVGEAERRDTRARTGDRQRERVIEREIERESERERE